MWLREQMLLEEMVLIDLLDTGLPQTFNLYKKNAVSVKPNKVKPNKNEVRCIRTEIAEWK